MDCVHIIFLNLIVTTLNTIATKSYMVGVRIETTKNNVNNMNCVHIIFQNLIVTTLNTISTDSYMVRVTIET